MSGSGCDEWRRMPHRPSAALCEAESHWDWSPPIARLKRFDVAKLTRSNDEAFVNTYREAHQKEVVVGAQTRTAQQRRSGPSLNLH